MKVIKITLALVVMGVLVVGSGCQNTRALLDACNTDLVNAEGRLEQALQNLSQCMGERDMYSRQLADAQRELTDLQVRPSQPTETGLEAVGGIFDPEKGTITVPLASDVLFDSGQAVIKADSKSKLNRIAGIIKQRYNGNEISVVGHTDTDPIKISGWKDNWELSTQRALSVTRYLLGQGISAQQLAAVGRGEYHPLTSNKSDNRRVEIVVYMF